MVEKEACRKEIDTSENGKRKLRLQIKKVTDIHESLNGNMRIEGIASNGKRFHFLIFSHSGKKQKEKLLPFLQGKRDVEVITTTHPSSLTYKYGEPQGIKITEHKYDPSSLEGLWFSTNRALVSDIIYIDDPKIIPDKKGNCSKRLSDEEKRERHAKEIMSRIK